MSKLLNKEFLIQSANECLMFSKDALEGYEKHSDKVVSTQFINLASQSIKNAQAYYFQNKDEFKIPEFEYYCYQFNQFSREFLWSLEGNHDFQHPTNFLKELEKMYFDLKHLLVI
ncbi:hypothetical protein U1P98_22975 [Lysinibacillus irui]|uniref:Nucleotidyltransferase n=1 Tax=Lysinibacillus irui TaxID=2998077 RepID=A0ABU5NSV1_9BACI|nr:MULTISPECIES: hypothetical protein [Lysinibacillus]MCM0627028.1 hypothetical protein [Lysinibacillus sp. OL1_EC]MEA0556436.1 hypothetical protein [Lysinibacillus irui]MEA0979146.1 hypothetical protein [Lysinibacillus irui]MEA1045300.1 hypothetical protein [Lysinibacillus irui]MED3799045.1 hypothetical protein [Lysinibacillus capsici]